MHLKMSSAKMASILSRGDELILLASTYVLTIAHRCSVLFNREICIYKNMKIKDVSITHWGRNKMTVIFQKTFSGTFSWRKKIEFWFKFLRILFLRVQLAISQHWLRQWLCTEQTTSHYLNQCWPSSLTNICGTRVICVKEIRVPTCVIANILLVVLIDLVSSLLSCIVVKHGDWIVLSLSTFILRFTTLFLRTIDVEIHVS